jgi:hypothetical protein
MKENSILTENTKEEVDFVRFKKFFLLEFTRQLIKNSVPSGIFELQTILRKEKEQKVEEKKEKIKERIKDIEKASSTSAKEIEGVTKKVSSIMHAPVGMFQTQKMPNVNPFINSLFQEAPNKQIRNTFFEDPFKKIRLSIPESRFPAHIQYIRPVPVNKEIELGKVDPLIIDSIVKSIECPGPGENLVVQGGMGTKKTGIILTKEEIDDVIQRFSKETKIPAQEGVFKVVAGRLAFLAIISEIVGSKFIIKKMIYEPAPTPPRFIR